MQISIRRLLMPALLAMLFASTLHAQDEEESRIFVKVFAGDSPGDYRAFRKAVRRNLKGKVEIPTETRIECEVGKWYGLGVIVSATGRQFLNFETTAIWRDVGAEDEPRRSSRSRTLRKDKFGTQRFFYEIRSGSVDHNMTFVVHIGKQVFVRHKFFIRGCEAAATTKSG